MKSLIDLLKNPKVYEVVIHYDEVSNAFKGTVSWTNHLGKTWTSESLDDLIKDLLDGTNLFFSPSFGSAT